MTNKAKLIVILLIILVTILIILIGVSIVFDNNNTYSAQLENKTSSYNSNILEIEQIEDKKENEVLVALLDTEIDETDKNVVENNISPYYIKINVQTNVITIYKKDGNGNYNIPLKSIICSCGAETPVDGTYSLKKYNNWEWKTVDNKKFARYATQISGDILIHSVPYEIKGDKTSLVYEEYDKLGSFTSSKSIRLTVADAKWIYENCPPETQVTFYTSDTPGPLNVTKTQLISEDELVRGWDPTDPDENNPWKNYVRPEKKEDDESQNTTENTTPDNENNSVTDNNIVNDNTIDNNLTENNNTVDDNSISDNQTNTNKRPENRVLEENDDVTIKSEVLDTNTL